MRSIKQYIAESVHYFKITVKIAGDCDSKFLDLFKQNLKKFDPVKLEEPKSTPIQKSPWGFPGLKNQSVTIIKGEYRYPVTEPMIKQMAELMGCDPNRVRLASTEFDESMDDEAEQFQNQVDDSPVLEKPYREGNKEASKAYSKSYLNSVKDYAEESEIDIPYAGKKTPDAFDPFKPEEWAKSGNNKSPMSDVKRPAKPKTGAGR